MTTEPVTGNDNLNKEIIQWGCKYLSSHGCILKSNLPENVQHTPWSYVVRFATSDGYIRGGREGQGPSRRARDRRVAASSQCGVPQPQDDRGLIVVTSASRVLDRSPKVITR
jgi:hypothetical protein